MNWLKKAVKKASQVCDDLEERVVPGGMDARMDEFYENAIPMAKEGYIKAKRWAGRMYRRARNKPVPMARIDDKGQSVLVRTAKEV